MRAFSVTGGLPFGTVLCYSLWGSVEDACPTGNI